MNQNLFRKKLIMLFGDVIIITASFYLAPFIRYGVFPAPLDFWGISELVATLVYIFVLYIFDFYDVEQRINNFGIGLKFFVVILIINAMNSSLFYLLHLRPYSSWVLFISSSFTLILLFLWRLFLLDKNGVAIKPLRIIIFGAGNSGRNLYDFLKSNSGYQVVGFVDDDRTKHEFAVDGIPVLGTSSDLVRIVKKYDVDKVIICITKEIRQDVYPKLVETKFSGVTVDEMPTFYEKVAGKIPIMHTSNFWMSYADINGIKKNSYNIKLKNVMDKTLAVVVFLMTMPLMILTAMCIKMESQGPVIYSQPRVGLDEKLFVLYKFRSMYINAESGGAVWAQKNDPRITHVGKIIRFLRIDELPQLWNVLKGNMSFVGPRPERLEFVRQLEKEIPYYMLRHSVMPGITGWAQINYNYGASTEDAVEKLQYDLYYIKNRGFLIDIYIMVRTIRVMLFGMGAR